MAAVRRVCRLNNCRPVSFRKDRSDRSDRLKRGPNPSRSRINRLRDERNVADKSDRIQKCDQEDEVTNQSIKKRDESTKHIDLLSVRGPAPRRMTTDSCEDKPKASVTRQNRNGRILHPKR